MKTKYAVYVLVLVFYFLTLLLAGVEAAEGIKWHTYDKGIGLAKNEGKRVFLHFYANWCFYCRKMATETFQDPSVIQYLNKNYIPIMVDSDKDKKTAFLYNVRALPSTWFLTEKGERIGNAPGYVSPKQLLEILKRLDSEHHRAKGQGG